MFGGLRHCDREDIMVLVCQVILKDHVIKRSCDFLARIQSRQVTILPNLVAMDIVVVEI